jgi:hypothetical protein
MELSRELKYAIDAASNALKTNDNGELPLPDRKRLWAAMGPRDVVGGRAIIAPGVRRRTRLALQATERVFPVWEQTFPTNLGPQRMVAVAEDYSAQRIDFKTAWNLKNRFWGELESLGSIAVAVGFSSCQAVTTALSDERFDPVNIQNKIFDRHLDPYEWDASFYASVAHAGSALWEANPNSGRRREFWEWYIREAVPLAWDSES